MPIAAVPAYLGHDFKDASPGMRFGMYLKLWGVNRRTQEKLWTTHDLKYEVRGQRGEERELKEENKTAALGDATGLAPRDKKIMVALLARQRMAFEVSGPETHRLPLEALATAPFTTGLGNEHPLENGFTFLNPYGLPYLPGSGIKGVLRQAARELASGKWDDKKGWTDERIHPVKVGRETVDLSPIDALFGREPAEGETHHVRGALTFWDVIPQIKGDALAVDIMTPHQSHYYQQKLDKKAGESKSPHDSGQPNPINFLTVPAGSAFAFHVTCDLAHLEHLAPDLAHDGRWIKLLTAAFEHAFEWLGFGAKTAVGYGAMVEDHAAKKVREEARKTAQEAERKALELKEREQARATMRPAMQVMHQFLDARKDKNQPELSAVLKGLKTEPWEKEVKAEIAQHVKQLMVNGKKWKEKSEKKNPEKDNDFQDTLLIKRLLS